MIAVVRSILDRVIAGTPVTQQDRADIVAIRAAIEANKIEPAVARAVQETLLLIEQKGIKFASL